MKNPTNKNILYPHPDIPYYIYFIAYKKTCRKLLFRSLRQVCKIAFLYQQRYSIIRVFRWVEEDNIRMGNTVLVLLHCFEFRPFR